jgi:hypothetical protein
MTSDKELKLLREISRMRDALHEMQMICDAVVNLPDDVDKYSDEYIRLKSTWGKNINIILGEGWGDYLPKTSEGVLERLSLCSGVISGMERALEIVFADE